MKNRTLYNITNHSLSAEQIAGFDQVVELPADLKKAWAQVGPTESDATSVASAVIGWLSGICGDDFLGEADADGYYLTYGEHPPLTGEHLVAVQGHFGATYQVVRDLRKDMTAVYASSVRESVEETLPEGGTVKRAIFLHISWNQY